jgi:EamA domain-containing membrane protein RarD
MEDKGMETEKTKDNRNTHAIILAVIGVIAFIVGIIIATVKSTHLRGSGLGTMRYLAPKTSFLPMAQPP